MSRLKWAGTLNLILGLWLFFSPTFGLADATLAAAWNSWVVGAVVSLVALIGVFSPQAWEDWVNLAAGVWIVLAPFIFDYGGIAEAAWNHVIVGVAIVAIAGSALAQRRGGRTPTETA